jgi:hypothetical protein
MSNTKTNNDMIFKEIITVFCEKRTKERNTLCNRIRVSMLQWVVHILTTEI